MVDWIKRNKVLSFLILLVVSYFLYSKLVRPYFYLQRDFDVPMKSLSESSEGAGEVSMAEPMALRDAPFSNSSQKASSQGGMVIQNSSISLLVSDVRETGEKIVSYAKNVGGFMAQSSYSRPDESAFATITVRVPKSRFDEAMAYYRSLSIKVTNEMLIGEDVTEEYVNIEERLETLEKTKAKFEEILDQASEVEDILQVTRELTNLQYQIDALIGQKESIEKNVELTKITLYLSTDELSLPYTPDDKFRPNVVFKLAVRSLVKSLIGAGKALIWVGVYSVIWLPILVVIFLVRKRKGLRR